MAIVSPGSCGVSVSTISSRSAICTSWSDAARNAVSQRSGMAESIVGVDVLSETAEVENQEITEFRTTVRIAYTPSS